MKDLLLLRHSKATTTGTTPEWCRNHNLSFDEREAESFFESKQSNAEYRAMIVFGGDMEAWEIEKYPWLIEEKKWIRDFIRAHKAIFGICLGSQLLAEQLGASVEPMGAWEFGWYPVRLEEGKTLKPLHCHNSYFTLPPKAERTAADSTDTNQGFSVEKIFVGFQFHTEIDDSRIEHIVEGRRDKNPKGRVQSVDELIAGYREHHKELKRWYFDELSNWWSKAIASGDDIDQRLKR